MADLIGDIHPPLSFLIEIAPEEDRRAFLRGLEALVHEDPAVRIALSSFEGRLLVSGEDELEMDAVRRSVFQMGRAEIGELRVNYLETVCKSAAGEGKYIRQTGGAGNYGHCKLRVEPSQPGAGNELADETKGDVIPKEFVGRVQEGVQEAMRCGVLYGFPMSGLKVTLTDGSYHEVDSNAMAFRIAGAIALKEAALKASLVLVEPIVTAIFTVPEERTGAMIGDVESRRGRIDRMDQAAGSQVIHAVLPLAEVLSSGALGRPDYEVRFAGFEAVPASGGSRGHDATACAVKPNRPRSGTGSATAKPDC